MEEELHQRDDEEETRATLHRLVLETRADMLRYARWLAGGDRYVAENLYSEALLEMYQAFPNRDTWNTGMFTAHFVLRIKGRWRLELRRRHRHASLDHLIESGFEAATVEFELSISSGTDDSDLDAALSQLSAHERQVLLARVEGYEPSAAARLVGLSADEYREQLAAVRSKVRRAIRRLRRERERAEQNRKGLPPVGHWLTVNRLSSVLGKHHERSRRRWISSSYVLSTACKSKLSRKWCSATRPRHCPRCDRSSRKWSSCPTPATT